MKVKFLLSILLILTLSGCGESPIVHYKYKEGQFVESVLTGQRGQVISTYSVDFKPRYKVRFQSAAPVLDGGFLKGAERMEYQPLSTIDLMKEYELRPVDTEQCPTSGCRIY